jgi:hypothetical protein
MWTMPVRSRAATSRPRPSEPVWTAATSPVPPARTSAPAATVSDTIRSTFAKLPLVDQRAERDLLGERVADRQAVGPLGEAVEVLVGHRLEHAVVNATIATLGTPPSRG